MPDPVSPVPHKPGHKSTEGLAALVMIIGPFLAALTNVETWKDVAVIGIAGAVAISYILGRSIVKRPPPPAVLALLLLLTGGAAHASAGDVLYPSAARDALMVVAVVVAAVVLWAALYALATHLLRRARSDSK